MLKNIKLDLIEKIIEMENEDLIYGLEELLINKDYNSFFDYFKKNDMDFNNDLLEYYREAIIEDYKLNEEK